jgi:ketosteroid isomerase-like protein
VSEANVGLLRRIAEAYNARDAEAFAALCDPEIEIHSVFSDVAGSVYRGHDGVRKMFGDLEDAWGEGFRIEPEAYFDLGERVVMYYVLHGRGKQSGADVALPAAGVSRWRDGLFAYWKTYPYREDALADLGVSEGDLEPVPP